MDKYKKLIFNTFIFAIGTFSAKILGFLLVPFYTSILQAGEFSIADLIVQTANLIIPIASVGMANSVIRYGLDKSYRKSSVFTCGIIAVGIGYTLFLLLYPLFRMIPQMQEYTSLIYLFVLTSCLRSLCTNFVRARQLVKLYAFDGVLSTLTFVIFNILLLSVFHLGIIGYVLATVLSDLCSVIFLFSMAGLRNYIHFSNIEWDVLGSMARYAIPLIPANIFWWITNVSDHYFVSYMVSPAANGIYIVSYKVPTMIILVSGIFTDAWQLSSITENGPGRERFFSNVFAAYQALIFTAASGLLVFARPITDLLTSTDEFYEAWRYIPFLVLATAFSCFVTFLGSIYMVEKKSVRTLVTTAAGAVINVVLNIVLIPKLGVNGAAFATFSSYFTVFMIRVFDTRRYIRFHWYPLKLFLNLFILFGQCYVLFNMETGWFLPESCLCIMLIGVNFRQILQNVKKIISHRKRNH